MWRTIILSVVNLALSALGTLVLSLPGFDLSPVGIVMVAQGQENIVFGALLLTVTYMIPRPKRFAFIWLQFPVVVGLGYLSLIIPNPYVHILLFHVTSIGAGLAMGMFTGRYMLYTLVNLGLNFAVARVYSLF